MPFTKGPIYPCNPATGRSESTKLSTDPKGEKIVYTNGRAVIIRDLNNPGLSHAYTQHTQTTTVARISPTGYYCASADIAGNVRIWDVTQPENNLKLALRPLAGKINDLAWDGESKRIIVGGEGKDKFGAAFFMDSGSSCGEIAGHAKTITAVSIRHQRPFKAISGSDDNSVIFHSGVPFKYDKMISKHTRFVRDVGFSPNGDHFASVASDGKLFSYEGKTGELTGEADRGGSTSSLMALSWNPESTKIATAGADGIVSLFDVSTLKPIQTYTVGTDLPSQQNGVTWAGPNTVVSVSLSGVLNVFDIRESSSKPWRKLYGPTKAITCSAFAPASTGGPVGTFYTGSFDGGMKAFDIGAGEQGEGVCSNVEGSGHSGLVVGLSAQGGTVWSAGWDEKVNLIKSQAFEPNSMSTKSQPLGVAASPSSVYVATSSALEIHSIQGGTNSSHPGRVTAIAATSASGEDLIAYGTGAKKVVLAKVSGGTVNVEAEFEDNKSEVLAIAFSPDGSLIAAGDASGRVILIDVKTKSTLVSSKWTFHTARISSVAFSPSGKRVVSGSLDEAIYVWEVEKTLKNTAIKNTHPGGVSGVSWVDETKVISTGADGCVRTWTVAEV